MREKRILVIFLSVMMVVAGFSIANLINNNSVEMRESENINLKEESGLENINKFDEYFIKNCGQIEDESVKYYVYGRGIWFMDDGVVFEIQEPGEESKSYEDISKIRNPDFENEIENIKPRKSVIIKLKFVNVNFVEPEGQDLLSHRSNFFYGNDQSNWRTNVQNYHKIVYKNIYNNIDLEYFLIKEGLKYNFIVHPDGNPNDIKLRYEGANGLNIDPSGNLYIYTEINDIVDSKPFIYQETEQGKNEIEGRFRIMDHIIYGFEILNEYDSSYNLIIDPVLQYSTFIGGSIDEIGSDLAVDPSGNVFVTGYTDSAGATPPPPYPFPTTSGAYDTSHNGGSDVFVLKLDSAGSSLLYSTFIGGSGDDYGKGIVIDSSGNAYVTGYTDSSGATPPPPYPFPTTSGAYDTSHNGGDDVFIFKLNSAGSSLVYSTLVGGSSVDRGHDIVIDSSDNAYVTGYTLWGGPNFFPTTSGAYDTSHNGGVDVFVLKLNSIGSSLVYSTYVGGSNWDEGWSIVIDSSDNVYVTGHTNSGGATPPPYPFPTTSGAYDTSYNGGDDVFVFKLNSAGSSLVYSTFIGGSNNEHGYSITIDSNGKAYVTGYTASASFPTTSGAYDISHNVGADVFVLKLNSAGSSLVYSTFIGGNGQDFGYDIVINSNGNACNAYVTGSTGSSNFPTTFNAYDSTHNGNDDVFVLKLNPSGSWLMYSTFVGGSSSDECQGIAIKSKDYIYVTGRTLSSGFPTTTGAYDTSYNGGGDVFVWHLDNQPPVAVPGLVKNGPYGFYGYEGSPITFTAIGSSDPDGDSLKYRWDWENDGIWDTGWLTNPFTPHTWYDDHIGYVNLEVFDGMDTDTETAIIGVSNVAPTANVGGPYGPAVKKTPVTLTGSHTDPAGALDNPYTYDWDFDYDSMTFDVDATGNPVITSWKKAGMYTIALRVTDKDGGYDIDTTTIQITAN